jgi:hypothetical protein
MARNFPHPIHVSILPASLILGLVIADDHGRSVEEYVHMCTLNKR